MTTQPSGMLPAALRRTPLSEDEKARAEMNFVPYVARTLVTEGRFEVTADTLELVRLFQNVARRVGDALQRPVVTYANGEVVVITFDPATNELRQQGSQM